MKEYFAMTAHWVEIHGGELSPQWVLCQRVFGAFPLQDTGWPLTSNGGASRTDQKVYRKVM